MARDAIAVSILNIRAEYDAETTKSLERNLNKLLFTRLLQEPRVFVLERQNLDKLDWEKKLSLKSEDKFWTASYILEGSFSEVSTNNISLNVNLLAPNGTRITNIVNTGTASSLESIVDQTAIRILKALQIAPFSVLWSPKDEAQRYYQEAIWADRWKLYPESISAIESSWALGDQTEKVAYQRLECYLHSLPPENEAPFVMKRLLELYLEYRRMFPQKSLKTCVLEEDSKKAQCYYNINLYAEQFFRKEEQNPVLLKQHKDILADIRSLILAVCREIDFQAEKDQISSPINVLIMGSGYSWFDKPRDYVAALYHALEDKNDFWMALFQAIGGKRHGESRVYQAFYQYGHEFNLALLHSSNSWNRMMGNYCELKWAITNSVTLKASMNNLMDDLWENRDDILNEDPDFASKYVDILAYYVPSDTKSFFYLDTFNLWKQKSRLLPTDIRELYNEQILTFHRKYLLYAISVRKIPPGWFQELFKNHLNMSMQEGQSFYSSYLSDPSSATEFVRDMFNVVYISQKVPITNEESLTTNIYRITMNFEKLKSEPGFHSQVDLKKIHNLFLPSVTFPRLPSTTSPYQSLMVTQYYSLGDRIKDIAFANGKIWAALTNRLVVLDRNSFVSTVVHEIARPEMQWVGSNLFLDTGTKITCLAPDNRVLRQWPKPKGAQDLRFYIFKNDLYLYKNGLIVRVDMQNGNSYVIASTRRKPALTVLDGLEFQVDRIFGSSDQPLALIRHGPKGCGVYAIDHSSANWSMIENFPTSHLFIVKTCQGGSLFFDATYGIGIEGIELWSPKTRDKQFLFGQNFNKYDSKWVIPAKFNIDSEAQIDNTPWGWLTAKAKMAEYDGNNLYLLTVPEYDDYQVLLWFFEKDRQTGVPIQLVFQTNSVIKATDIISIPVAGNILEINSFPPNPLKVNYSANYVLTGCPRGLIMAMKNATGFWFLPIEDIRAHMTPKPALLQQQALILNAPRGAADPTAPVLNKQYGTSTDDHSPFPGRLYSLDIGDGVNLEMVWIPPGEFMMGSPSPERERDGNECQHKVIITKGFWMGKYEVTQEQWMQLMSNNPSRIQGANLPVDTVGWHYCQIFLAKLNALISDQNSTDQNFRFSLPTEAEWEYACRAGTTNRFYTGDSDSDLDRAGWYLRNSGGTTHPVGQKQPNAWGLYDMHGNVLEWCADWYAEYEPVAVQDPKGMKSGKERVLRSSNISFSSTYCRSAKRFRADPDDSGQRRGPGWSSGYGFRIVLHP